MKSLFARVWNLLLSPRSEWDAIGAESAEPRALALRYVAPLTAIPAIAMFVGLSVLGVEVDGERYRSPAWSTAASSGLFFVLAGFGVYAFAWIIGHLAPRFGGKRDFRQAFKLSAYSITAAMLAGALTIIPALGVLALLGTTYSLYLLFLGAPKLMRPAEENATNFAIVSTVSAIVLALAVGLAAMAAALAPGGLFPQLNQLREFGLPQILPDQIEASLAPTAVAPAATLPEIRGANAVFAGSGELKDAAPLRLAGLDRIAVGALSSGPPGARALTVDAEYRKGDRYIVLQMTLSNTIATTIGFGGPATSEYDRETTDGYSRRRREGDVIVVEDWNEASKTGSHGRLLQDRFYVRAVGGGGVRPQDLKRAAEAFDLTTLARFEAAN